MIFEKDVRFWGRQGLLLKKYSQDRNHIEGSEITVSDVDKTVYVFETLIECFLVAAMLGVINERTAPVDKSGGKDATILSSQLLGRRNDIARIVSHMKLATTDGLEPEERIKAAFRTRSSTEEKEIEELFCTYVAGGLEIIDEYLGTCSSFEEIANSIYKLSSDYIL